MIRPQQAKSKRRLRFSLRSFLIVAFGLCICIGWLSVRAERQRKAVQGLKAAGRQVGYDFKYESGSTWFKLPRSIRGSQWLHDLLGIDYFATVVRVEWDNSSESLDDDVPFDLALVAELPYLNYLELSFKNFPDLLPLSNSKNLEVLFLSYTPITDLAPLANLKKLTDIHIDGTNVADLTPLANMPQLEVLDVSGTKITNISSLANLTHLKSLDISETSVSDLTPIGNLKNINFLDLNRTPINDLDPIAGFKNLEHLNLEFCKQVKDWKPLADLKNLGYLKVIGTPLADDGVSDFQKRFPKCYIRSEIEGGF